MNPNNQDLGSRTHYAFETLDEASELQESGRPYIQTLRLTDHLPSDPPKAGFWRRQFRSNITWRQQRFDWAFGVVLPVLCFFFDPFVFTGSFRGSPVLGAYKPFAYLLSFAAIMATIAWLLWGKRLGRLNAFLAGLFAVAFVVSLCIGLFLLPFSLLGLLVVIGLLGFTPLLTSFVFLRNSVRAFHFARPLMEKRVLVHIFALSAIAGLVVPYVVNVETRNLVLRMLKGDAATARHEANKLHLLAPVADLTPVVDSYRPKTDDQEQNERGVATGEFYKELTGRSIEDDANRRFD